MKSGILKSMTVFMLVLGCTLQLSGCGSEEHIENRKDIEGAERERDFVYVAKHQKFDINGKVKGAEILGDKIYFLIEEDLGQTGKAKRQVYGMKVGEDIPEIFPLEMEEGDFISSLSVNEEKNLFMIVIRQSSYFLNGYTAAGELVFQSDITGIAGEDAYFYIQYMASDREGNIYVSSGGSVDDFSTIWIFDKEGNQIGRLPCETWAEALFTLPSGKVAVSFYEEGGNAYFREIEDPLGKFGRMYGNLPEACSFAASSGDTMLLSGKDKVYRYDLTAESCEELVSFSECDLDGNSLGGFGIAEDGSLLAVCQKKSGEGTDAELVYLEKKTPAEAAEAKKEPIVLGVMFASDMGISDAVLRFNRTNENYRIEVVGYGEEDYEAGKMRLDAELAAGRGPDVLWIDHDSMRVYEKQGILENLYPYMDEDHTIKREDLVESVLAAFEKDGKLLCFSPDFSVDTMIARTSDVGEEPGWTIEEAVALMESKPEGTELFRYGSKRSVLESFLYGSADRFINWETGACSFDGEDFEKLLIFADGFPKEPEHEEEYSEPQKLRSGAMLTVSARISGVESYQMYTELFGEAITFIGYPTGSGTGSYIQPASPVVGINANAEKKEAAWEFVRSLLSLEYQSERAKLALPILKEALEAKFEESMTPEYGEIDGEQVEEPKFEITYDDWRGKLYAATEEEMDAVRSLVYSADGIKNLPQQISNMIMEEADAFFEGQKSVKEAARTIQSRVRIFVNENR